MSAAFVATPATVADVPEIVEIFLHAFESERSKEMIPPTPESRAWLERAYEGFVKGEAGRHQSRVFVLHDENGKTVGYSFYWIIDTKNGEFQPWHERHPARVAGLGWEKLNEFFTIMENNHRKAMGQESHIFLETIAVHTSVRGRGLAAKMLEIGMELADALDYPSYLDANKLAVTLYERAGYIAQDTGLPFRSVPMRRPKKSERQAKA
ncbi:hypothetical protein RB595_008631 [Gaeumannomyces hyphopodioides]